MKTRFFSVLSAVLLLINFCLPVSAADLQASSASTSAAALAASPAADSGTEAGPAAEPASETGESPSASGSGADSDSGSETDPGTDPEPDPDFDTDSDTDAEPDADADSSSDADADTDADPDADADTDTDAAPDASDDDETVIPDAPFTISTRGETDGTGVQMQYAGSDTGWALILPASADPAALPFFFTAASAVSALTVSGDAGSVTIASGDLIDLTALCSGTGDSGCYALTVSDGTDSITLSVRFSASVAALYLTSDDPIDQGRTWVESSADKTNQATGSMVLEAPDGSIVCSGALTQIKGRGNTTWLWGDKKPYQIKLSKKADLLETGDSANRSKTWVLLANCFDATLLHNAVTFDLAAAMNMDFTVEYRFVDLYYDGEYRGSYILCEKVAVDSGRVDITSLEDENEDANPDIEDFSTLSSGTGTTENGAEYHYWYDMASPENISGGYLLEMDYDYRAEEEACWFKTAHGNYITVKSPEYCSQSEMDYIASCYQDFEDAVYGGGTNPATGKTISEYADMTSVADCYLINEFSKNCDSYLSSCYLYKDADDDLLRMGPVWDYDLAYGFTNYNAQDATYGPEGWVSALSDFGAQLWQSREFRIAVYQEYRYNMLPLLEDTLLGDKDAVTTTDSGRTLHSFAWYEAQTAATAACNYTIWPIISYGHFYYGGYTYESNLEYTEDFLTRRTSWLLDNLAGGIFTDVSAGRWYTVSIADTAAAGLMNGKTDTCFDPDEPLTRAETAQIIYNIAGRPEYTDEMTYTDISHDAWYIPALAWCTENGVLTGYTDNTARPDSNITRQELVALLYRYSGSPEVSGDALEDYSDAGDISAYARDAVEWAVENGILHGYKDGTILPRREITRAECAVILANLYT